MKTAQEGQSFLSTREFDETEVTTKHGHLASPRRRETISATRFRIARFFERSEAGAIGERLVQPLGNRSAAYQVPKRVLDIIGAACGILLLSPILLGTFLVLMATTKGRPIFVQTRVGLCGRTFRMYKFRSMRLDADQVQHLIDNEKDGPIFKNRRDPRITRIGQFIRSSSIDELPQLFNVLKGDMALVGPRPPITKEVVEYQPWQLRRLSVKPGLTCLWQVSGRSEVGFEDWVRMDLWYVKNQSLMTDLALLIRTPWTVITRRGAY